MKLHTFKHPWYELYQNIGCSGIIYVNDVVVSQHFGKNTQNGFLTGQVPINQVLLQSGKYKVKGIMFPRNGEETLKGSKLKIDFNLSDYDSNNPSIWKKTEHQFHIGLESPDGKYVPNPDPNAEYGNMYVSPLDNLKTYVIETEIEVEVPFVLNGWQNSMDLSKVKTKDIFAMVLSYYRQIHALLKEHNAIKFLEISKDKINLQREAFYMNQQKIESIHEGIISLFNENLQVEPLIESELKLEIMGYGKLVRLMKKDGTNALQFKSPDIKKENNITIDIMLHMPSLEKGLSII